MKYKRVMCAKEIDGLSVSKVYRVQREIPFRYLITNEKGIDDWYSKDYFIEQKDEKERG
jgi:hypothetical protein